MKRILSFLLLLAVFVCAGIAVRTFGLSTVRIAGTSMNDTLINGDVVLVTRFDYRFGKMPQRGEIVECRFPGRSDTYVKRVIGLPGERIAYTDNVLYVNGTPVSEPYAGNTLDFSAVLKADEWFVMGDNRMESYDSRAAEIGSIGQEAFIGKARWIIWPLSRFGSVN